MKSGKIILWGIAMLIAGCGPQNPQIPSQRKSRPPEPDSTQLAVMELNMQLAQAADEQLAALVQKQEESYALYNGGAWATIIDRGDIDRPMPRMGEECAVHLKVFALDGRMLEDSEGTYCIGKMELPAAVDTNIREWHHGCRVKMYAPWYSAYGIRGTRNIPPYENVLIEIELR